MHSNLLVTLTTLGIFAIDQLIKRFVILSKGVFLSNPGIAFSLPFPRMLLIVLSLGIIGLSLRWWLKKERRPLFLAFGFGLFLGGALGNLFDRIFREGVVDYINIGTSSFNVADGAIILGILLLLFSHYRLAKNM